MVEYVVDVTNAKSWESFIAAFNEGFVHRVAGDWKGNLDAFSDYLYWPEEHPYRLVIRGWHQSAAAINEQKTWDGRPVLDVVAEILRDNSQVEVVLE